MQIDNTHREPHSPVESYLRVLHALMLRDMRTRFGGSLWGYAVVVLWPVTHVFFLLAIYAYNRNPIPVDGPGSLFFASAAAPVLAFQYISREVMKSIAVNRQLTYFPQVKFFDLILSRVLVEIVTGFLILIVIYSILIVAGINPTPTDPLIAVTGYLAAIALGIGMGTVNVAILGLFPGWLIGYSLVVIVLYISSGIIFLPSLFPEQIYLWMKYIPTVQLAEWVRSAYYPELHLSVDYEYVLLWALTSLTIGLIAMKYTIGRTN